MSALRCWPGCLAITENAPQDNGLVVEVIERPAFAHLVLETPCWVVRSLGSPFHMTPSTTAHECWWPDAMLRPITPPPGTVTTDEVQELYQPKRDEVPA